MNSAAALVRNGLWAANPALVQLLGISPLLAVSTSVARALGLGLATTLVLTASSATVALLRRQFSGPLGIPAWLIVIGALTAAIDLLMRVYCYPLHQSLGIFVPLIVANGLLLGRAEDFASTQPPPWAALDGLVRGAGFALVLLAVGTLREALGAGTLFADMEMLFGEAARDWQLDIVDGALRFPLLLLPPGAFFVVGLLIAIKNGLDARRRQRHPQPIPTPGAHRVRATEPSD